MKKTFTKIYYGAAVILLILGASRAASGQTYTNSKLATNAWATAICNDASGNIYAVESANKTGVSDYGKVVKYATNGTVTTLYTGNTSTLPFNDCDGSAQTAIGIAVTSNGDVYVTTNYDFGATNCASTYGAIIKLAAASGYAESSFLAGSVTFGGFTALAVDQSDNLYALVYDQTGNSGGGSYEVEEFPSSGGKGTAPVAGSKFRINNSDACKLYVNALNSYSAPENETALTVDPSGNIYVADAFDGGSHSITGTTYKLTKGSGNSYTKSTFLSLNVMGLGSDVNGNIYATYNTGFNATTLIEYVGGSTTTTHTIATGLDYTDEFELNSIAAVNETDLYINDGEQSSSDNDGIEQFFGAPTTQASGVSFSSTTEKTTNITWTNGNGTTRAVFAALSSAGSISLSNGTLYTASTTFGSGTAAGTGWSCIYNGTGNSVSISNLAANTGYKVMVVEFNGTAGAQDYDTGTGTNNPNTFTTPANPSLTASGGTDSYNIGGTAATVDAGITVTAGQTNLSTATISVSTNYSSGDALNFTNQNGITGSLSGSTLTLSGSSSVANYQTALRSITFTSSSASSSTRTISFLVGDGTANSSTVTKNITVTASTTLSSIALVNAGTNNLSSVQYTVTFAAAVSGLSTANFTATGVSGTLSGQSVTGITGSNPYTVTVNTGSGSGVLRLDLTSNSGLSPTVSNEPYTSGATYTIDKTAPVVSSVGVPVNGAYSASSLLLFTVNFSKNITVNTSGGTPYIPITIGSSVVNAIYVGGTGTAALTFRYAVVPGDNDSDGITVGSAITLNGGTLADALGNTATLTLNSVGSTTGVLVDTQAPSVSSITATTPSNTNPTNATSVTYTVTFSEAVTGVDASDFALTTSGTSGSVSGISGSNASYTVTVSSISGNGSLRLDLKGSGTGIADLAGNAISGGFTTGSVYTIDQTAPTVAISAPSVSSATTGPVTYTVTYADANFNTSTLAQSDITLNKTGTANGTVGLSGSGTSYTVTISGITGAGTLGISIPAGKSSDLAGNVDAGTGPSATFNVLSTDATLSNLQVDAGNLKPVFASGTTSYTLVLGSGTASVTVTPTSNDANATIAVNGTPVTSGSGDVISLTPVINNVSIVVTAQDGVTTQTYSLTVARVSPNNTNLITIRPSTGGLSPGMSPTITSYTSSVSNLVTSMTVTPTTGDPQATITVNGVSQPEGTTSAPITLNVGDNAIAIEVTSANGNHHKTYTLTVTRAPSSNALLSSLVPSQGVRTSGFSPLTNNPALTVGNVTSSITITPTTRDANATVTVNGVAVTSGTASAAIPLSVGDNTITTVVTAQDMTTTNTYTMVVTRAMSSDANLITIRPNHGTLSPTFSSDVISYAIAVPNSVSSITLSPGTQDATATLTVNQMPLASGATSDPIPVFVGDNPIAIVVTAQDGTQKTYTVTVTRAAPPASDYTVYAPISVSNPTSHPQMMGEEINVHQGLSPNGDGINDFLLIDGINNYPDNKLQIMNRSGQLVFEAKGYDNSTKVFDGHSNKNGAMQLPGTYFYSLDFTANGVAQHKTGFIVLKY